MNPGFLTYGPQISSRGKLAWGVVAGAMILLALAAAAQVQLAAPSGGLINPRAIVFGPANGKVYAVDTSRDAVEIYADGGEHMHRVRVGSAPVSIAVNASTGRAYVANSGDGTVSVLDGDSDAVVATVPIGSHPYSIASDETNGKVFVTHTFDDQVSVLDGATNAVTELKTGAADLIAINSRSGTVYLLGYGGALKVLDEKSGKFSPHDVGRHGWGLTLDDSTGTVYVARIESADLVAMKTSPAGVSTLPAGAIPCAIAVDAKTQTLYVADYGENTVAIVNAKTGRLTASIPVGDRPEAIAFDPQRNLVYVANTAGNSVSVIDGRRQAVVATLPAGISPYALAVDPGSNRLYVANESNEQSSSIVDLSAVLIPNL